MIESKVSMNRMTSYVNQVFTSVFKFQRQKDASLQALAYPCLLSTFFDPCNNFLHSCLCFFWPPSLHHKLFTNFQIFSSILTTFWYNMTITISNIHLWQHEWNNDTMHLLRQLWRCLCWHFHLSCMLWPCHRS